MPSGLAGLVVDQLCSRDAPFRGPLQDHHHPSTSTTLEFPPLAPLTFPRNTLPGHSKNPHPTSFNLRCCPNTDPEEQAAKLAGDGGQLLTDEQIDSENRM